MIAYAAPVIWLLCVIAGVGVFLFVPPIAQDPAYHQFVDRRTWLGIPHVGDVLSNIGFVAVGLWGLWLLPARLENKAAYVLFFAGVALVGVGSASYHWAPNDNTLIWDRLPMSIAFMALLATFIGDRFSARAGRMALWPLVAVGVGSVVTWQLTGDLRPYGLVQFLPVVLAGAMCALLPSRAGFPTAYPFSLLALYALAKVFELFDARVWQALGETVSGHSLKHLFAAAACATVVATIKPPR